MSGIRIVGYKALNGGKGSLRAFLKIEIVRWCLQINGVMLHKTDKSQWIQLPMKEYQSGTEKKYTPMLEFRDESVFARFQAAVLRAVSEYKPADTAF
jgi:hypothetical protein